jgi:maintenance of morphology protein 1
VVTLGIETKLVLNYPKPFVMVLPVALSVSVVRFSGTLSLSFSPSSEELYPNAADGGNAAPTGQPTTNEGHPLNPTGHSPTTLTFTFLDDYRLDLSVHSLIGSRSRLQDVPKIAQLVEGRIHQWFDERCVEPRFQQIVLPSLWPRKKNTRGGDDETVVDDGPGSSQMDGSSRSAPKPIHVAKTERTPSKQPANPPDPAPSQFKSTPETTAEQRTRDWAAQHSGNSKAGPAKRKEEMSEIEAAGEAMREADDRARRKEQSRLRTAESSARDGGSLRMRTIREASHEGIKASS